MEDDDMASPFWLQTPQDRRRFRRRRRNISSVFLNSGLLLTLLLLIACLFIFLIIPSFLSFTSQILRPHSLKKSWDSLNLVLVLFAIICGFLSRNGLQRPNSTAYQYPAPSAATTSATTSSYYADPNYHQSAAKVSLSPRRFYDYSQNQDRLTPFGGGDGLNRLRSFNSYPDLRHESLWIRDGGDDQWRFYDDIHVRDYRFPSLDEIRREEQAVEEKEKEIDKLEDAKDIAVDTCTAVKDDKDKREKLEDAQSDPLPMNLPPPPVAAPMDLPAKIGKKKVQKTYRSVAQSKSGVDEWKDTDMEDFYKRKPPSSSVPKPAPSQTTARRKGKRNIHRQEIGQSIVEEEKTVEEIKYVYLPPPSPAPPPPPPPPEKKKRSKDFLISLRRKKKKKQRQNSVENLASLFDPESEFPAPSSIPPSSPLPPPPPPPPPPHFFQNPFPPKRGKSKKIHSVSVAPPPPPPPPRPSSEVYLSKSVRRPSGSRIQSERPLASAYRPPKPVKTSSFGSVEDNAESGASPLIPIPPPPPPPPFKMPAWKFEVRGDYVRVASFNSSRSGSPDLDSEDPSDRESSPMAAAAVASPLFCPSPDVNTKADNFIARFKAGLKLEKVNSGKGKSNLGPSEGPN